MTGSLDTNILLRLILEDVPEQSIAVEKLLAEGKVFEVADAALFEMIYVLEKLYKINREQVAKSVLAIARNTKFNCNRKLFELTMPLYVQESKLSIIDCALTHYAKLNNATPLFTFDIALQKSCSDCTKIPH
jgi:predicted nucleic-acid-binding protein